MIKTNFIEVSAVYGKDNYLPVKDITSPVPLGITDTSNCLIYSLINGCLCHMMNDVY